MEAPTVHPNVAHGQFPLRYIENQLVPRNASGSCRHAALRSIGSCAIFT
jgi:hypothetical protein